MILARPTGAARFGSEPFQFVFRHDPPPADLDAELPGAAPAADEGRGDAEAFGGLGDAKEFHCSPGFGEDG